MSHVVSIKAQVKDLNAVKAACARLQLAAPVAGVHRVFVGSLEGLGVRLPGWSFPVVFNLTTGEAKFDNYGGTWGKQVELDKFMQAYAIEKAKAEARRKGFRVAEASQPDGSIRLTCTQ